MSAPEILPAAFRLLLFPLGLLLLSILDTIARARNGSPNAARSPTLQLASFLLASLALYPASGATALVQFASDSNAWTRANSVLDSIGRSLFWLAQGLLLAALVSDVPPTSRICRIKTYAILTSLVGATATALGLCAPFVAGSSAPAFASHGTALSLDLTSLATTTVLLYLARPISFALLWSALSAAMGDILGILGATLSETPVGRWTEVARAASTCAWAVALVASFVALEVRKLQSVNAQPASEHDGSLHQAAAGSAGPQYGLLSSTNYLPELSSPTATGRLDISPAMTWSTPEISTPRSTSYTGHASRISSLYCPPQNHQSSPVSDEADGADDSGYTLVELVAVPISPKQADLATELPPDRFSPPPRPISARLRPSSPRTFDLRRASKGLLSPTPTSPAFPVSPLQARHRSLPQPWTTVKHLTPTGSPLNSPLPRLSLSDDPDPFSRSSIGAAPVLKHSTSYDPELSAPRPSPRYLDFPAGVRRSHQAGSIRASDPGDLLYLTQIQEELRPPMNHSRWSTDSSVLRPSAHGPSSFWSRRGRAALPTERAQAVPTSVGVNSFGTSGGLSLERTDSPSAASSTLSRLGSLVSKKALTAEALIDPGPTSDAARTPSLTTSRSGRTGKERKRPSRLNFADVSHSLRGSSSASPLVSALSAHQQGGSVDKASISRPTHIEGLSPWSTHYARVDQTTSGVGSAARLPVSTPSNPQWL